MCEETLTTFTCGHGIRTTKACSSTSCPKPKQKPNPLNDTCAPCHPPFVLAQINREHDASRQNLIDSMTGAKSASEQLELQRSILRNELARKDRLAEAGKIGWNGLVDWGHKYYKEYRTDGEK